MDLKLSNHFRFEGITQEYLKRLVVVVLLLLSMLVMPGHFSLRVAFLLLLTLVNTVPFYSRADSSWR